MNLLFVTTNNDTLAPDHPTGLWLEEFVVPYNELLQAGAAITVASPNGGAIPLDPKTEPSDEEREKWATALRALESTVRLDSVSAADFDAIFLPGGHGPLIDLTDNTTLHALLTAMDSEGKIIAAVCHGPTGLLNAKSANGDPLIKGHKVTGFTNTEERMVMLHDVVPFLLEDEMKARGGDFESALLPFVSHVVRDGNLITGQNPASSHKVAEELVAALRETSVA